MAIADSHVTGGDRLKAHLDAIKARPRVESVEVGFYKEDRYPDGTGAPVVAAVAEFGLVGHAETGFMRIAQHRASEPIRERLAKTITPTHADADDVGRIVEDTIRDTITEAGLVDTGKLKRSVRHKVVEGGIGGA